MKLECRLSISFHARDCRSGKPEATALSLIGYNLDKENTHTHAHTHINRIVHEGLYSVICGSSLYGVMFLLGCLWVILQHARLQLMRHSLIGPVL